MEFSIPFCPDCGAKAKLMHVNSRVPNWGDVKLECANGHKWATEVINKDQGKSLESVRKALLTVAKAN